MTDLSSSLDAMSQDPASRSPIEFKQILLSSLNDEAKVLLILVCTEPRSDIILLTHQDREYSLELEFCPLDRPEVGRETYYRQLKYTAGEGGLEQGTSISTSPVDKSFRSTLPKHPSAEKDEGDFFLPIGWFVENVGMGYSHLTRYACMLNVSTQPVSMWAVYDYVAYNDENDTFMDLEDLNRIYMEDMLNWNLTQNPVTGVRAVMNGKDLVLLYEDIKDWHPDRATVWNKPGKEAYLLGKSVRAYADVLPPKELLDAITVKNNKQEPKTETCKDNAVYAHATHAHIVNRPTGKEDAINGSAITGDTRQTVDEYVINNGDTVKEDAISKPTAQKITINNTAKLPSPKTLLSELLPTEVLPTKAKPKRTASRMMLAGPPACKQRTK